MNKKTIVVVGAGKGLGNAVARLFGENDFRVILISRNLDRLNGYKAEFETTGIETYVYAADCEKPETLTEAFKEIQNKFGAVDVLVYNAAVLEGGTATEFDNANFLRHYQVDVASALHCAKLIIPKQAEQKSGAILLTGGILGDSPASQYTGVSVGKAALKALGKTLHEELKEKGIYVGLVTVCDVIAPDTKHSPELIAEKFLELYRQQDKYEISY